LLECIFLKIQSRYFFSQGEQNICFQEKNKILLFKKTHFCMTAGIDSISFSIPRLFLPIPELATHRNIDPDKLTKGLGLQRMSFPDVHQDVVTMASNAVWKLLQQEDLTPSNVDRIYVGTESGVDSSKPVASYVISNLEMVYGEGSFRYCDVVDMTFACIGAMDALHNCLDFIRLNPGKKAIVIATDLAKYDLGSSGEYTQGAGAIAMLITSRPRIMSFSNIFGVSSEGVFDFFKPRRYISKASLGLSGNPEWNGVLEAGITLYKEQPVFEGQYSNECYINRVSDAYSHFKRQAGTEEKVYESWACILMHLPYCYQGRRTFIDIFAAENPELLEAQAGENPKEKMKALAKSPEYLSLVKEKLAPAEVASGNVGNIYTGSMFLGMLSTLCAHSRENTPLAGKKVGLIGYGSGSKSKVMEAEISNSWQEQMQGVRLFETLEEATPISFSLYESLHKAEKEHSVIAPNHEFYLQGIEKENPALLGARYYGWV
jgi:hydroxymethylglutaryl-CoA synthase